MATFEDVPRVIWMLWFQGWDKAPELCKQMLRTWRLYNPGWEIRIISRQDFPELLGDFREEYARLRWCMNLGDKLGLSAADRAAYEDMLVPPAAESDLLRLHLLNSYGGVWVDATNLCRRPLDEWLPAAAASAFFAFFGDRQSPQHKNVPHIISSFIVSSPNHCITSAWLQRTRDHWSTPFSARPDLDYLWVNVLFRQLVATDPAAREAWARVPTWSCEHGKPGPMLFYSGPEALAGGARLFELLLAPATPELAATVENDRETPMWKLAFREEILDSSAYWHVLGRTLAHAVERACASSRMVCASCDKIQAAAQEAFKRCGQCKVATYCSRGCQQDHWRAFHKKECRLLTVGIPGMK